MARSRPLCLTQAVGPVIAMWPMAPDNFMIQKELKERCPLDSTRAQQVVGNVRVATRPRQGKAAPMGRVDPGEVLLLWRALSRYRSGARSECKPRGRPPRSDCPLFERCPRWTQPDDRDLTLYETFDETERRRAEWPCSRVLDLLGPDLRSIGGPGG